MKDIQDRKWLAKNKNKNKKAKQLAEKKKEDNFYFIEISKDIMQLKPNLVCKSNPSISLKNTSSSARN